MSIFKKIETKRLKFYPKIFEFIKDVKKYFPKNYKFSPLGILLFCKNNFKDKQLNFEKF